MTLQEKLRLDMVGCIRAKQGKRLSFIRFLIGQLNLLGKEVDDERVVKVLNATKKTSTIMKNQFELDILAEYLPKAKTEDETRTIVANIIKINSYSTMKDMGKVMTKLKEHQGIDGRTSSAIVKELLK